MNIAQNLQRVREELPERATLVAVSKTHPVDRLMEAYEAGQRIFGENRPQEMAAKRDAMEVALAEAGLKDDVRWHQIGHLQTNKVKMIVPFVEMIHSVDSARLAREISKQAIALGRVIDVLLEIRIAKEATKEGWGFPELEEWLESGEFRELEVNSLGSTGGLRFRGVMGVATFVGEDPSGAGEELVRSEFQVLTSMHAALRERFFDDRFDTVSMGMSSDYRLAVECGATMVRLGSVIFGERPVASVNK